MGATLQPFILLIKNLLLHLYRRVTEYNLLLGGRDADVVDLNYKKEWMFCLITRAALQIKSFS